MTRKMIAGIALLMCVAVVHAEPPTPIELDAQSVDLLPAAPDGEVDFRLRAMKMPIGDLTAMASKDTDGEVGDPYSFGRAKIYLGVAQTEVVAIQADCSTSPADGGPCIETVAAPGLTLVDESDLASIELPEQATTSILCFTFTPISNWQWSNSTGSPQMGQMFLRPTVKIESEVLLNPALINPQTGLPFDGVLLDSTISTFLRYRTLQDGEIDFQYHAATRACTGGLVNVRELSERYDLPAKVIERFFNEPITVSFGVRGSVSMVDFANFSVGVRLYGDK